MIWQSNPYSRSPKTLTNRFGMCLACPLSDLSGSRQPIGNHQYARRQSTDQ
ncbi:hypothetical protein P3T25_008591 [Paraburkholderia sp. GAS32]